MVAGVIIAGGMARRLQGADKPLVPVAGRPLAGHVVARFRPQVDALLLNANGDPARFAGLGVSVQEDMVPGDGPLAGLLTGMLWARGMLPEAEWLASVPVDTPFLPTDLVQRLHAAAVAQDAECAMARSEGRAHPIIAVWWLGLASELQSAMANGLRRVEGFLADHRVVQVSWDSRPVDPFFNVNTREDLHEAARLAGGMRIGPP